MKLYKSLAKFYDLLYLYHDYDKESALLIRNLFMIDNPRLLDVACGTGTHLEAVSRKLQNAKLTGIDLNQDMLDAAAKKRLNARLIKSDMKDFNLREEFDLVYCLSSSIQYNLTREDFENTLYSMRKHAVNGKVIFDLAYCAELWKEGYTNITANSNEKYEVAELYTSHSKDGFSYWNPLYLIKDKQTGEIDMHVDKHIIKLWGISEVEDILKHNNINYVIRRGFSEAEEPSGVPIFILGGLIN
ncbi:MAG: class I SAM-dependent methyltransferase [Nanoarchaeota archaeon]|nr:class I SAM-dependent methyltransferase [Nanoarchaeota archaeon]MBU0962385.1 class I SAM-dependent methyltransferase [Nanoarchaeota archaeon]